jgi:hypothetical protein
MYMIQPLVDLDVVTTSRQVNGFASQVENLLSKMCSVQLCKREPGEGRATPPREVNKTANLTVYMGFPT